MTPSEDNVSSSLPTGNDQKTSRLGAYFSKIIQRFHLSQKEDWLELAKHVPFLGSQRIHRLWEAFGGQVGWVILEDQYIDRDYRDTFSQTFSKRFATPSARCQRLHFFSNELSVDSRPEPNMPSSEVGAYYLGYAVVRPTRPNGLGRAFLDPRIMMKSQPHLSLCLCKERVTLFGWELTIRGFPFIGQDIDVTTCAQSTLWMLRRYYSNRYNQYAETHPNTLSRMASMRFRDDRSLPATGLDDGQMAEMLRGLGFSPKVYVKKQFLNDDLSLGQKNAFLEKAKSEGRDGQQINFSEILRIYLDSGIPLVLSFSGGGEGRPDHSGACFGIASLTETRRVRANLEMEEPREPMSYSLDAVVVADDNYAPYLTVSNDAPPESYPLAPRFRQIESLIVPLPERINILAEEFDLQVREIIKGKRSGKFAISSRSPILKEVLESDSLVLRCYLTSCRNFKQGLVEKQGRQDDLVVAAYRIMPMPHFVWICELHDIRSPWATRCLGEVVWDSTCNRHEWQGLLALSYPELFALNGDPVFENRVTPDQSQGWLEIALPSKSPAPYSPGGTNLVDI